LREWFAGAVHWTCTGSPRWYRRAGAFEVEACGTSGGKADGRSVSEYWVASYEARSEAAATREMTKRSPDCCRRILVSWT